MSKNTLFSTVTVFLIILVVVCMGMLKLWLGPKSRADEAEDKVALQQVTSSATPTSTPPGDLGQEYTQNNSEPITFSTDDLPVVITKKDSRATSLGTYLADHARQCGPHDRPASYFGDLARLLAKLPATVYTIRNSQSPARLGGQYSLSVVPNELGYKDLHSAEADFFSCPTDNGVEKPVKFSGHWVVFTAGCSSSDEACKKIANVVLPSIQIKS